MNIFTRWTTVVAGFSYREKVTDPKTGKPVIDPKTGKPKLGPENHADSKKKLERLLTVWLEHIQDLKAELKDTRTKLKAADSEKQKVATDKAANEIKSARLDKRAGELDAKDLALEDRKADAAALPGQRQLTRYVTRDALELVAAIETAGAVAARIRKVLDLPPPEEWGSGEDGVGGGNELLMSLAHTKQIAEKPAADEADREAVAGHDPYDAPGVS